MTIYRGVGGGGNNFDDTTTAIFEALAAQANQSATSSAASAAASAGSAADAADSSSSSSTSAGQSSISKVAAEGSEVAAAGFASAAAASATAAQTSGSAIALTANLAAPGGSALVGYTQGGTGAVARTLQDSAKESVNLFDFMTAAQIADARTGSPVLNHTTALAAAMAAGKRLYINGDKGEVYRVSKYPNTANLEVIGVGRPTINLFYADTPVMVQFGSNSYHEGIKFQSTEVSLSLQRATLENSTGVYLKRCGFHGFRHNVAQPDAWGLYLSNSTDCTIDYCDFGDNSQSDIAVVDNNRNIAIINPINRVDTNGVHLNVEPNSTDGVIGLVVTGGRYRIVQLNENDTRAYASQNLVFTGASITSLLYDGSNVVFNRCDIASISNNPDGVGAVYAGGLMSDTIDLGPNLFVDPYFYDVSTTDVNSFWTIFSSAGPPWVTRINDAVNGKYLRANSSKGTGDYYALTRTNIAVTAGEKLIVFMRARCDNTSTATVFTGLLFVQWINASAGVIATTGVKTCRTAFGTQSDWVNDLAVLVAPPLAVGVKVFIGATGAVNADIAVVGLFRPTLKRSGLGNMPAVISALSPPNTQREFLQARVPTGTQGWPGYFVGERLINRVPVVGQPKAWVLTVPGAVGASGTWVSEGNL